MTTSTHRSPVELINIYWEKIYNEGQVELVREVCADPLIRHDPDTVTVLSHDDQIARVTRGLAIKPFFTHRVLHTDGRFVTSVWNMTSDSERMPRLCGIEVFEVEEGRLRRNWNSTYMKGLWGEEGQAFDPSTLTAPELISHPSEITADWIQRAFAAGGKIEVQRITSGPDIETIGHGTTSATVRIQMGYNDGQLTAPTSTICKMGQVTATVKTSSGPFERELRAYELFGPSPAFRIPQLYYGEINEDSLCNMLLEDLSAHPGDQIAGCSINEAKAVIKELAAFHLSYWENPDNESLEWLAKPGDLLSLYLKGAQVINDFVGDILSKEDMAVIDRFGELAPRWLAIKPARNTLAHRDARVDNILFEQNGDSIRACLIDWQNMSTGDPIIDIAYFLSGSISVKDRRDNDKALVTQYSELIAKQVADYSAEEALASYRINLVSGLWLTIIATAVIERDDHNIALIKALITRNIAAVQDWDSLAALCD